MSIFNTIWKRNINKTDPKKLADDVDTSLMHGIVSVSEYNNGLLKQTQTANNLLVNGSKTNLIRLLAQVTSSNDVNAFDPKKMRIDRIRFGNRPNPPTASIYDYYDYYEPSIRRGGDLPNVTPATRNATFDILADTNNLKNIGVGTASNPATWTDSRVLTWNTNVTQGYHQVTIKINELSDLKTSGVSTNDNRKIVRPPSQSTARPFKIIVAAGGSTSTITWGPGIIFTKNPAGIFPLSITTTSTASGNSPLWVNKSLGKLELIDTDIVTSGCFIAYKKDVSGNYWEINLLLNNNFTQANYTMKYDLSVGETNVINSIVPVTGFNAGISGTDSSALPSISYAFDNIAAGKRYNSTSVKDYYSTDIIAPTYANATGDYIDDYSITFSAIMNPSEGNNGLAAGTVKYTEACLCNANDDMFSHIVFGNDIEFSKIVSGQSGNSFIISWTILTPLK